MHKHAFILADMIASRATSASSACWTDTVIQARLNGSPGSVRVCRIPFITL